MFPSSAMENEQVHGASSATKPTASPGPSHSLDRGRSLWARGACDQAIAELDQAIRENPTDAEAYCLRGEVLASTGDAAGAIADFSEAIRLDFYRLLTCASRVLAQASQKQLDMAAAVARDTLSLNRRLARAHVLRGRVFAEQGERAKAIADCTQALDLEPGSHAALVQRGEAYYDDGDLARAIADFSAAIELDPSEASIWSKRGRAFHKQGDFDRALADFTAALERDPQCAAAFADRGTAYLDRGEHERAVEDFNRAIHLDPRCPRSYVQRSLAHAGRCDYERALSDFSRALALDPRNYFSHENQDIAHRLKEQYDQSVAELNRVRSAFQTAVAHFAQAMDFEPRQQTAPPLLGHRATEDGSNGLARVAPAAADDDGDDTPLEQEAEAPLAREDEQRDGGTEESRAEDHLRQAQSFHAGGDYEEAIEHYTLALQLDPACLAAYLERGRLYRARSWFDRAIADFTAALAVDDGSAEAYLRRGNAYAGKGEYQAAITDFNRALALAPGLAGAYVNRALAFAKLGEYEQVIADADRALEMDPRLISALFLRGAAYSRLERAELAIADFDMLLLLSSRHVLAYNERGLAHASRGEYALAIADYTRALHLQPAFESAFLNRAIAYRLAQEPDRAIAELDDLIARAPDHAAAYHHRGLAYLDGRQYDLAIADLTRAFQLDPQCKEAYTSCLEALRAKHQSQAPDTSPAVETIVPAAPSRSLQAPSAAAGEAGHRDSEKTEEARPVPPPRASQVEVPPSSPAQKTAPETTEEVKAARTLVDVGKLRLECPTCGTLGLLDVRNLQKAFRCPGCARWWRTDGNGQLTAVTPVEGAGVEVEAWSNGPGRSKHSLPAEAKSMPAARAPEKPVPRKPPRTRPRQASPGLLSRAGSGIAAASATRAGRWALAGAAVLLIASVGLASKTLLWPDQLRSRGRTLVQSWLARDLKQMERFTLPTQKPFLESWLTKHPPPDLLGQDPPPAVRISVERNDGRTADVVIQIAAKDKNGYPVHYVFHQRWAQQGGDWYFHPQEGKQTFK